VTTDLQYIRDCVADSDSEPLISDSGWVLLVNENRAGFLYIYFNVGIVNTYSSYPNIDLAWTYLHELFWKYDRQLINGYMNSLVHTFYTARKVKQQDCSIATCNDFDPMEDLTTELGETYFGGEKAKIGKAIIRPYGQIDLNLLYGPDDKINPGYVYEKIIHVWEVKTALHESTFYALSFLPVTVQVDIVFNIDIQDAELDLCTTAPNSTLTILNGERYGSVVVSWCNPDDPAAWSDPTCIMGATLVSVTAPYTIDSITANISDESYDCT
jgi:hypothetical protein